MNPLCILLEYTPRQYSRLFEDLFISWCELQQISPMHLQQLLTDQRLINWFQREYQHREGIFVQMIAGQPNLTIKARRDLYDDLTTTIFTYPKPLLADIKQKTKRLLPRDLGATQHYLN